MQRNRGVVKQLTAKDYDDADSVEIDQDSDTKRLRIK